jgi:hypothetical protein
MGAVEAELLATRGYPKPVGGIGNADYAPTQINLVPLNTYNAIEGAGQPTGYFPHIPDDALQPRLACI